MKANKINAWRLSTIAGVAVCLILLNGANATAAEKIGEPFVQPQLSETDKACLLCHEQTWRNGMWPDGTQHSVYIDPQAYQQSKHFRLGAHCGDCHGFYGRCLHPTSVTFKPYLEDMKLRCLKCHEKQKECLECHRPRTGWEPVHEYAVKDSIHKDVFKGSNDPEHYGCKGCHENIPNIHSDYELRPAAATGNESCGRCHVKERKAYLGSVHGAILADRPGHAPNCVDCHGSHYINKIEDKGKESTGAIVKSKANPYVCGECHREEFQTYIENYHGRAVTAFNSDKAPTCYDCHGDHEVESLKDPKEALKVCKKCHKSATLRMLGYKIHAEENNPVREPGLYAVKSGMTLLLVGTLAAFYLHSGMWFYRKRKEKLNGELPGD